ncbi:DUF6882 domain-containing protein [Clostridium cellulovorans]|uniref:Uncharacterized protein n=1 Tax=Clostridium cellulovorans (strain ATCC 35296 / DSM 3052 / OCM 3 / 743B) TaxID=573061 RepID=D9SW46_CLOC7|nr:DUF6882 domain-containing protein [Clostridium cellulovorans]ADL51190.1 hypothetical protein Clocel_1437 [Clostridium cellulovorans 743B]
MTDEQFDQFINKCYEELEDKQKKLFDIYNIGSYESYWFDQMTRTLQFKNNDKVMLEFKVLCIGTWAHQKNNWMWGWANESFTDEIREEASVLKGLKELTGYDVFEELGFQCDEIMAYEAVAMALSYLDALGMYKIPGGKSHLFLALLKNT